MGYCSETIDVAIAKLKHIVRFRPKRISIVNGRVDPLGSKLSRRRVEGQACLGRVPGHWPMGLPASGWVQGWEDRKR